jgi:hypothetical protein
MSEKLGLHLFIKLEEGRNYLQSSNSYGSGK